MYTVPNNDLPKLVCVAPEQILIQSSGAAVTWTHKNDAVEKIKSKAQLKCQTNDTRWETGFGSIKHTFLRLSPFLFFCFLFSFRSLHLPLLCPLVKHTHKLNTHIRTHTHTHNTHTHTQHTHTHTHTLHGRFNTRLEQKPGLWLLLQQHPFPLITHTHAHTHTRTHAHTHTHTHTHIHTQTHLAPRRPRQRP